MSYFVFIFAPINLIRIVLIENKMKRFFLLSVYAFCSISAIAGGLLTNSNQSINYERYPAREASIGVDGVYTNPAGVAFMEDGFHFNFNNQTAIQDRVTTTTYAPFAMGLKNHGDSTVERVGEAHSYVIPSLFAAYNKNTWSFQLGFHVNGGGGKLTYDDGLASLEKSIAVIPGALASFGANAYDADIYMKGRQYYFGLTAGVAKRLNDNLAVSLGARVLYGNHNYSGYLRNVQIRNAEGMAPLSSYVEKITAAAQQAAAAAEQYKAAGNAEAAAQYAAQAEKLKASAQQLSVPANGIEIDCDQTGFGIAPIIGIDYKIGKLNLAAKYEFETHMMLENKAHNSATAQYVPALAKFKDGEEVAENTPAMLTVGAQYEFLPKLRAGLGFHYYFDKQAEQFGDRQKLLDGNSYEFLLGVEYDINDKLQVSTGGWTSTFGLTDDYMNDLSFNTNSWSWGLGLGYKVSSKVQLNVAYFHSFYDTYKKESVESGIHCLDEFTRRNNVFGIGINVDL